jgi:Pre-mRNA-splicing factor of RES complex
MTRLKHWSAESAAHIETVRMSKRRKVKGLLHILSNFRVDWKTFQRWHTRVMDKERRLDDRIKKLSGTSNTPPPSASLPDRVKWDDPIRFIHNIQPPKYFPPNRFSIPPGARWDGIDRSNGFEIRWLQEQNAQIAKRESAYRYDHLNL